MSINNIFTLCVKALLIQFAVSQCTSRATIDALHGAPPVWTGPGLPYDGLASSIYDGIGWAGKGVACDGIYPSVSTSIDFTPTTGGGLVVTSGSPIPPIGISVVSDNAFEGALSVAGEVPFVGSTAVEGLLPAAGAGGINHACGDGVTAMVSEIVALAPEATVEPIALTPVATTISPAAALSPAPFAPRPGLGLGNRFGNRGCGNHGLLY